MLPPQVRVYYDADDMIGDVVIKVCRVMHSYDRRRGACESTWVWRIADNCCKAILSHYYSRKYTACSEVELTQDVARSVPGIGIEVSPRWCPTINGRPAAVDGARLREACEAVSRVIQFSSAPLREILQQVLGQRRPGKIDMQDIAELRWIARKHSVTLRDFEIVRRYATA